MNADRTGGIGKCRTRFLVVVDGQSCRWYICELRVRSGSMRRSGKMPIIDLSFVLVGTTFPLDHGYCLFSAICRVVPGLHGDRRIGVHPIRGRQTAPGVLTLDDRSRLKLRLPSDEIALYIALAGQALELEGHRLRVGIPSVQALTPAENLAARLVTF